MPPGLNELLKVEKDQIVRLKRGVYGLADAPRAWYTTLDKDMRELGFTKSKIDPALYMFFKKRSGAG